jgi:hypothetical protein
MALRIFTDFGAASRNQVTLRVNLNLFISNGLIHRYKLEGFEYVCLYIDDEKMVVGLKFTKPENANNKEIRKVLKEKSGISINISPILRFYGVSKLYEKKNLDIAEEDGLLVLDLSSLKETVTT